MNSLAPQIRVPGAHQAWLQQMLAYDQSELDAGKTLDLGSAAALGVARARYAIGEPWNVVAGWLQRAASNFVALERLRDEDGQKKSLGGVRRIQRPLETKEDLLAAIATINTVPVEPEHSFTNSWSTLNYAWAALAACDNHLASEVVQPMWDPPDAPYIGADSKTCTFAQQRAARAVRALLLGNGDVGQELGRVPGNMPEAKLVRACVLEDRAGALAAVTHFRQRHEESWRPLHKSAGGFLALDALGAVGLLVTRGLLDLDDLGEPSWYFPFRLAFAH